ncbi:hypothetical protein ONZ51_g4045 [Trametes cubensis]|uniref:DUF6534 domain-containing protein n=1 Tax=Trametes cubensis TaxID=1111947 RepID=A0AAD7TWU6_9APHY|nr:hypothetical protein ONZ51_g4045 [Trametes cubensis]
MILTPDPRPSFYCCRVYNFGAFFYKWILIPAVVPMCVAVTFGFVAGVEAFRVVKVLTDLDKISWMVSVAYGLSAGSDIVLSSILIFALLRVRSQSKIRSTKSVLKTLIIYTINTVSFFAFLFAIVNRQTLVYAGISIVGAKLYANSVLALLNSRRYLNNRLQDDFASVSLMGSDTSGSGSGRLHAGDGHARRRRRSFGRFTSDVWDGADADDLCVQRSTFMSQVSAVGGGGDGPAGQITSSAIPEESERGSTPAEAEGGGTDASEAV